jgi:hypothetical protein
MGQQNMDTLAVTTEQAFQSHIIPNITRSARKVCDAVNSQHPQQWCRSVLLPPFHAVVRLQPLSTATLALFSSRPCARHYNLHQVFRTMQAALAKAFSQFTTEQQDGDGDETMLRQLSIDGKTLRGSKDADGKAEHVLSAFSAALAQSVGHSSSRGKGFEIPDALRLLEKIDLEDLIVTGDAMFCQKAITYQIVEKGGDYILPVKKNQKDLLEEIETAFKEPVFPPRTMARATPTRSRTN